MFGFIFTSKSLRYIYLICFHFSLVSFGLVKTSNTLYWGDSRLHSISLLCSHFELVLRSAVMWCEVSFTNFLRKGKRHQMHLHWSFLWNGKRMHRTSQPWPFASLTVTIWENDHTLQCNSIAFQNIRCNRASCEMKRCNQSTLATQVSQSQHGKISIHYNVTCSKLQEINCILWNQKMHQTSQPWPFASLTVTTGERENLHTWQCNLF